MADSATPGALSIKQIEGLIARQQRRLSTVVRQRAALERKLKAIDERIQEISGLAGGGGGRFLRPRNAVSLVTAIEQVLTKSAKPMGVKDIMEKVLASGYRSNSANFRAVVNLTLIKEKKRFRSTSRGVYALKR
jgi:hypothetical protein